MKSRKLWELRVIMLEIVGVMSDNVGDCKRISIILLCRDDEGLCSVIVSENLSF